MAVQFLTICLVGLAVLDLGGPPEHWVNITYVAAFAAMAMYGLWLLQWVIDNDGSLKRGLRSLVGRGESA